MCLQADRHSSAVAGCAATRQSSAAPQGSKISDTCDERAHPFHQPACSVTGVFLKGPLTNESPAAFMTVSSSHRTLQRYQNTSANASFLLHTCPDPARSASAASSKASGRYTSSSCSAAPGSRRSSPKFWPATEVMRRYSLSDSVALMDGIEIPTCNRQCLVVLSESPAVRIDHPGQELEGLRGLYEGK